MTSLESAPRRRTRVPLGVVAIALVGSLAAVIVVAWVGFDQVLASAAALGWVGFIAFGLYTLAVIPILGAGWLSVTPPDTLGRRLTTFAWARLLRDSASDLLPFSQVGGLIIGVREATTRGLDATLILAATILDLTTELAAQLLYTLFGVGCLLWVVTHGARETAAAWIAVGGLVIATLCAGGFLLAQRRGLQAVSFPAARWFPSAVARAETVQMQIFELYRRRLAVARSIGLHLAAWIASGFGAWIVLRLMGRPIGVVQVLAIESLLYAVKSFAFVVPNAIGVQEGAYALIGPVFGLPADAALALSLVKRARDLALGAPVLLIWQGLESRRLLVRRSAGLA